MIIKNKNEKAVFSCNKTKQKVTLVEVPKPTGLTLKQTKSPYGGLTVVSSVGNSAASGIKPGDTVVGTSSFFGDEIWPSDKLGFTKSALEACPSPVLIEFVNGPNQSLYVKKTSPRASPKIFGRKLTS